jgi:hypothetical protein
MEEGPGAADEGGEPGLDAASPKEEAVVAQPETAQAPQAADAASPEEEGAVAQSETAEARWASPPETPEKAAEKVEEDVASPDSATSTPSPKGRRGSVEMSERARKIQAPCCAPDFCDRLVSLPGAAGGCHQESETKLYRGGCKAKTRLSW